MIVEYNGSSKLSGIYEIRNRFSNKSYIGSAKEFKERWSDHSRSLRSNKHQNKHLQNSFNNAIEKLQDDNFLEFYVIEVMEGSTKEQRLKRESYWIEQAVINYGRNGIYNVSLDPEHEQSKVWSNNPTETAEKIRRKATGRQMSEESRKKMSDAKKGKPSWNKGLRKPKAPKIPKPKSGGRPLGYKVTEETKKKLKDSRRGICTAPKEVLFKKGNIPWSAGKAMPDETKKKIAQSHFGKKRPDMQGNKHYGSRTIYSNNPIVSPNGIEYVFIECIREFCKQHGIRNSGAFGQMINGKRKTCEGWKYKELGPS